MLVYRVLPYSETAAPGNPGHPLFLPEGRGSGRLDNPNHYRVWYLALEASGAIGEAFGNLAEWSEEMFVFPRIADSWRSIATYSLPDDTPLLDLDDANALRERGLRPSQVVSKNRSATQRWSLSAFQERNDRGERLWQGVRWWSSYHDQWRTVGYWGDTEPEFHGIERLSLSHAAVKDAMATLKRIRSQAVAAVPDAVLELK